MGGKYQIQEGDTLWRLAQWFYGDGRLHRVLVEINYLSNPDHLVVGQELEIPYVTFRHQVTAGDTPRALAKHYYNDETMAPVIEVANHAGQRDLIVGEWLLIPDLVNTGHHTVVDGETLAVLAERWYGEVGLWPVIAVANNIANADPQPGQVLARPLLNRRHKVVAGDTLWELANQNYGDGGVDRTLTLVKMVAAANLLPDPDIVTVGQVIFFPSFELGGQSGAVFPDEHRRPAGFGFRHTEVALTQFVHELLPDLRATVRPQVARCRPTGQPGVTGRVID